MSCWTTIATALASGTALVQNATNTIRLPVEFWGLRIVPFVDISDLAFHAFVMLVHYDYGHPFPKTQVISALLQTVFVARDDTKKQLFIR
jgi:hypothetical protein